VLAEDVLWDGDGEEDTPLGSPGVDAGAVGGVEAG
jgi:hypothetical protein